MPSVQIKNILTAYTEANESGREVRLSRIGFLSGADIGLNTTIPAGPSTTMSQFIRCDGFNAFMLIGTDQTNAGEAAPAAQAWLLDPDSEVQVGSVGVNPQPIDVGFVFTPGIPGIWSFGAFSVGSPDRGSWKLIRIDVTNNDLAIDIFFSCRLWAGVR